MKPHYYVQNAMKLYIYSTFGCIIALIMLFAIRLAVFYWLFYDEIVLPIESVSRTIESLYSCAVDSTPRLVSDVDFTSHYAVTLIFVGDEPSASDAYTSISNFMFGISSIVSSSINVLSHSSLPLTQSDTVLLTDVVDALTANSRSLWIRDYCEKQDLQSCQNLVFVVYCNEKMTVVDDDSTNAVLASRSGFLWKLDGSYSWGSFLVRNRADSLDDSKKLMLSHLQRMLQIPDLIRKGSNKEKCTEISGDEHSNDNALLTRVLQWTVLKNTLMQINSKVTVIHSLFLQRNALLWYDVLVNADWVRQYKRMVYIMTSVVELFPVNDNAIQTYSADKHLEIILESLREANRIAMDLHDDPLSKYRSVQSSRLALEEYFAVFAPFWLPIFVPIVKSVKLLLSL